MDENKEKVNDFLPKWFVEVKQLLKKNDAKRNVD